MEPGWLAGQIKEKVGWFPESFAEPIQGPCIFPEMGVSSLTAAGWVQTGRATRVWERPRRPPPPPSSPASTRRARRRCPAPPPSDPSRAPPPRSPQGRQMDGDGGEAL